MPTATSEARLIQLARKANREALTRLTSVMLKPNAETHFAWKGIPNPTSTADHCRLETLAGHPDIFWVPLIDAARELAQEVLGARLLWASISLDEKSEVGKATLGLESAVVLSTVPVRIKHVFKHSFTRAFLDHRNRLRIGDQPASVGILAVNKPLKGALELGAELHLIHFGDGQFRSADRADQFDSAIESVNGAIGAADKWAEYIRSYEELVDPKSPLLANLSATSFYDAVASQDSTDNNSGNICQAGAQLVVGLSKAPKDVGTARLFYQLLQLLLGGIPPMYSSLSLNAREIRRLRTQDARMRLIERPLAGVSGALARVQAEVQELNAVLYDPARSLFRSHRVISDLFTEGASLDLCGKFHVTIRHQFNYPRRKVVVGKAVVAVALCRILGRAHALEAANSVANLVERAKRELDEVDGLGAGVRPFDELAFQLKWLCGLAEKDRFSAALRKSPEIVWWRLKEALFDPYKIHTPKWPVLPLVLAARCFADPAAEPAWPQNKELALPTPNPTICQHVVELLMAVAAGTQGRHVVGLEIVEAQKRREIRLNFNTNLIREQLGVTNLVRHIADYLLDCPREWRIEHEQLGNWRKPFVDFASRLLELRRDPVARVRGPQWYNLRPPPSLKRANRNFIISLCEQTSKGRFFVFIDQASEMTTSSLVLQWLERGYAPEPKPPTRSASLPRAAAPKADPTGPYLLDHRQSIEPVLYKVLTRVGLLHKENAAEPVGPEEFLARHPGCPLVFLHARDKSQREAWNKAVRSGLFKGHLVHMSARGYEGLSKVCGIRHPQSHVCERPSADWLGELKPLVVSLQAAMRRGNFDRVDWSALLAPPRREDRQQPGRLETRPNASGSFATSGAIPPWVEKLLRLKTLAPRATAKHLAPEARALTEVFDDIGERARLDGMYRGPDHHQKANELVSLLEQIAKGGVTKANTPRLMAALRANFQQFNSKPPWMTPSKFS